MRWFRLYSEFAHDPKVQSMPEEMQRRLIMLYCLQADGCLGSLSDDEIALALRLDCHILSHTKSLFLEKNFICDNWKIRAWKKRQYQSDSSAERMRRHRDKMKRHNAVTVTSPSVSVSVSESLDSKDSKEEEKKKEEDNSPQETAGVSVPKRKVFVPPTDDEMRAYFISLGSDQVEAAKCYDYYVANGWRVGRNPMRDWRAAARNWRSRVYDYGGRGRQAPKVRQPLPTKFLNPDTGEYEEG